MRNGIDRIVVGGVLAGGLALATLAPSPAVAAERRVAFESFTATWCVYCPPVRQAYRQMSLDHPDIFFPMGVHGSDSYTIPWGTQRNAFYGVPGYPTTWTDGMIGHVGGGGTWQQHYATMLADMNARRALPTDVWIQMGAEPAGASGWEITVVAGVDPGAPSRTVNLHLAQVLDDYPTGNPAYTNTIIQAASPLHSATLVAGQPHVYQYTFALTGPSATNVEDVRFFCWAQDPGTSGPKNIHNAAWLFHPFPSLDCNGNGQLDIEDIQNGSSEDCNGNGFPDECDIASASSLDANGNGTPDECEDCNGNGEMDWMDIQNGSSADCNENGFPDECDIAGAVSADCNANGTPDECEIAQPFSAASAQLGPIGTSSNQLYIVVGPQPSYDDVVLSFAGQGDFDAAFEVVNVSVNGQNVGSVFRGLGNCTPLADEIVVPRDTWNALVDGQATAEILMTASGGVDANDCGGGSWIQVEVAHTVPGSNDADADQVPDDCAGVTCPPDVDGSGAVDFGDLLGVLSAWGPCTGCPADVDASGTVDFTDLLAVLSAWGPC